MWPHLALLELYLLAQALCPCLPSWYCSLLLLGMMFIFCGDESPVRPENGQLLFFYYFFFGLPLLTDEAGNRGKLG